MRCCRSGRRRWRRICRVTRPFFWPCRLRRCGLWNQVVRVEFPDGSLVQFAYAFYLVNADKRALAVFTEHCGYHVFPLGGVRVFENGVPVALPH